MFAPTVTDDDDDTDDTDDARIVAIPPFAYAKGGKKGMEGCKDG